MADNICTKLGDIEIMKVSSKSDLMEDFYDSCREQCRLKGQQVFVSISPPDHSECEKLYQHECSGLSNLDTCMNSLMNSWVFVGDYGIFGWD
jgi:cAMP phosphodiesterase